MLAKLANSTGSREVFLALGTPHLFIHKYSSLISLLLITLNLVSLLNSNYLRLLIIKDTFLINQYDDKGKLHVWLHKI